VSRRTALAVAVVGALLIGGATTGTTHALWRDQGTMPGSSVTSGTMSHTVTFDGTTPLGSVSLIPGEPPKVIDATLLDSSLPAKNLRQGISFTGVDLVGQDPGVSLSHLRLSIGRKTSNGCSAPSPGAADGDLSASLSTTAPGESVDICLRIAAVTGTTTGSATLRLSFAGEQVRPGGQHAGWTSGTTTSLALAVGGATAPVAPGGLQCVSQIKGESATLTWATSPGLTYALVNNGQVKVANITSSMLPLTIRATNVGGNNVDLKVRVTNSAGVSTESPTTFAIQFQAPKCSVS
jgi:hypothetical protein